jgi:hypothetical protein
MLDNVIASVIVRAAGTKLVSSNDITLGSNQGREALFNMGAQGMHRFRFYIAGSRIYMVNVSDQNGQMLNSPEAERFFDSFRITN